MHDEWKLREEYLEELVQWHAFERDAKQTMALLTTFEVCSSSFALVPFGSEFAFTFDVCAISSNSSKVKWHFVCIEEYSFHEISKCTPLNTISALIAGATALADRHELSGVR